MKNWVFIFLLLTAGFFSCSKDEAAGDAASEPFSPATSIVVKKGDLASVTTPGLTGLVKIYRQPNGRYVLALEQVALNSANDLNVYLSAGSSLSPASVKLFSFKNIDGEMYYELPAFLNVSSFRFVLIQGDILNVPTAVAELL